MRKFSYPLALETFTYTHNVSFQGFIQIIQDFHQGPLLLHDRISDPFSCLICIFYKLLFVVDLEMDGTIAENDSYKLEHGVFRLCPSVLYYTKRDSFSMFMVNFIFSNTFSGFY